MQKTAFSQDFCNKFSTKAHGKIAIALFVLGTGLAKQQLDALHGTCRVYKLWNSRATNNKFNQQVGECQIFSPTCIFPPRGGVFAFVWMVFPSCFCQFCVNCAIFVDIVRFAWYNIQATNCNCQSCAFATICIIQQMEVYRSGSRGKRSERRPLDICLLSYSVKKSYKFIVLYGSVSKRLLSRAKRTPTAECMLLVAFC